jgi:hypothetical protein
MSKIIQAINTMITHSDKISKVIRGSMPLGEIFFLYDQKYKWSISKNDEYDTYFLHFYSDDITLEELAAYVGDDWDEFTNFVTYSSKDLKAREAYESMGELYRIVKEKAYGIDKALDDIINDLPF